MIFLGIYTYLEDKWYDLVDWLNQYIPIANVVDSVDRVIPSFILFLALLLLLLVGIFVLIFSGGGAGFGSVFEAEVTVLSRQGAPVPEAIVSFGQVCSTLGDVTIRTDSEGKATFKACSDSANVRVSKEGYSTLSQDISFENNKAKIYLSQLTTAQRIINLKVKDSSKKIIPDAKLYLLCVKGGNIDVNLAENGNQSSSGYLITLPSGCDSIQLKATAEGYNEKKEIIGLVEENKTIFLEKNETNGTVVFTVDSASGKKDAVILVTDELGREDTIIIDDSTGSSTKNYSSGSYSYTATLYGVQKSGTFIVTTGQTTDVEIFFKSVTPASIDPVVKGTASGIYLKLLDGNIGVGGAELRVFYKKGNDTNYFTKLYSSYSGIVGHSPVSDYNSKEYYVLIKSLEYETKLVKVDLKTATEAPQEIILSKGGADLKIKVIDDVNAVVKNAVVSLKKSDFGIANFEEPQTTDSNGRVEFKSLPNGYYKITGVSSTQEGTIGSLRVSGDAEVVLTIVTGTGSIKFNLIDNKGETRNAYCELFESVNNSNDVLLSSANTTLGYFQAASLKAKKNIYLSVPDTNYIYVESPVVEVKRGTQTRDIILYKQSELPNSNKVQMFLEGIFESNPWATNESKATKLLPGKKYYMLFTLIANNETSVNTTANIFVSPKDKNAIDANTKMFLEDAYSTRSAIVQTSLVMNSSIIPYNPLTPSNPTHAKQLNVYFGEKQGLIAFPLLVQVSIDANAVGSTTLYWEGIAGNNKSILYSKEFTLGQSFCFGAHDCPDLLFSNYIKRQGTNESWVPIGNYSTIQIGELYDLNVVVENLTDVEIGSANIVGKIKPTSQTKVLFENDLNKVLSSVNVSQFDTNWAKFVLEPLAVSPAVSVIESLENGSELSSYNGNNAEVKFAVKNKEDINMQVIATNTLNTIYAGTEYSLFYIKTFYKSNKLPSKTIWEAKVKGANFSFATGTTDENGEWLGSMDFSGFEKGTVIVFTAHDANGSNPATLEITLTEAFSDPTTESVADCITIKIGGTDIKTMDTPTVSAVIGGSQGSFTVDSNCVDDRLILIKSDLGVTPSNQFTIKHGASNVSVTLSDPGTVAIQRSGVADSPLLGAYPMQILQVVNKSKFNQIGFIDVIVTQDGSTFTLANPIFDMRSSGSFNGTIINNNFNGRQDIYYPQMDISTNSVGLTYTKPGVPATVDFNAVVKSHAIEAISTSYSYGSLIHQWNKRNKCNSKETIAAPDDLIFTDLAQSNSADRVGLVTDAINAAEVITTPDANDRDPSKSFYALPVPIQQKIRSELSATSGTYSATASTAPVDSSEQKVLLSSASFTAASADNELSGDPMSPGTGDTYEIIPTMAGDFSNSSCDPIPYLNEGACDGVGSEEGSYSDDEGSVGVYDSDAIIDDSDSGEVSSTCSKCEINYDRVRIDPKSPTGYDGSSCNGVASSGASTEATDVTSGDELGMGTLSGVVQEKVTIGSDSVWTKVVEDVVGRLRVIKVGGCHPCQIRYFGDWLGGIYTKGKKKSWWHSATGGLFGSGGSVASIFVQDEYMHAATFFNERVSTWSKELSFTPKEGTVVRLEPKYGSNVNPKWMNTDTIFDENDIDYYKDKNVLLTEDLVVPHGLVPFSVTGSGYGEGYSAPDPTNTLVEYGNNGLIYSELDKNSIPSGVRVFLKGGYIYAEYIGDDKAQTGNNIDFTVSKVNLQGSEYAIVSVRDWVQGVKVEKTFQVKLLGNPNNCYSTEGIAGLTGKEFAPKLLFNWDWNTITYNQCDSTNSNYTYCDAAQFTISMFKRLQLINETMLLNNNRMLPQYASFYAYLIKDNYSRAFLNDFDYYYSTTAFSSNGFNSTSDSTGYDKFISENKIDYNLKTGVANISSGALDKGGLYRVEIETVFDNSSVKSLFNQGNTNANIHVIFTKIKEAPNYNLFYETPFDGGVGKQADGTFKRVGYGTSLAEGAVFITDSTEAGAIQARNYTSSALVNIIYSSSEGLAVLNNQKVLTYTDNGSNGKTLEFNPMQPTPIVLSIKDIVAGNNSAERTVKAPYVISGNGSSESTNRTWQLVSSTLGNSGKCTDFLGNQAYSFTEQSNGAEKYFQWEKVIKSGTVELGTVFFTPPNSNTKVDISSAYATKLKLLTGAGSSLTLGTAVQLANYDKAEYNKYQSIKGMLDMIAEGKLCVSQNAAINLQIWWSQDYLNALIDSVPYNKTNSCLD